MEQSRMIDLRNEGWTLKQIASAAEVSIKKVFSLTGGRKGPERKPYATHRPRNVKRDKRIRENVNAGLLLTEVAKMERLSPTRIGQIVGVNNEATN